MRGLLILAVLVATIQSLYGFSFDYDNKFGIDRKSYPYGYYFQQFYDLDRFYPYNNFYPYEYSFGKQFPFEYPTTSKYTTPAFNGYKSNFDHKMESSFDGKSDYYDYPFYSYESQYYPFKFVFKPENNGFNYVPYYFGIPFSYYEKF